MVALGGLIGLVAVFVVQFAGLLYGLGPSRPQVMAPPCDTSIAAVEARHAAVFPLLRTAVGGRFACGSATTDGQRVVLYSWSWQAKQQTAEYTVSNQRVVTAVDANAKRIDTVAQYGPVAVKMLVGS